MSFTTINASQTAAKAPVDQSLMDTIRLDLNDLDSRVTAAASSGASNIDALTQKLEAEKYGVVSEDLDNSLGISGRRQPTEQQYSATLLKTYTSGDTSIEIVWNAIAPNSSDQNMDSTTGWTATGAGASLTATTTAGEFQVGSAALKFDKNNSAVEAAIRFDNTTQTINLSSNTRAWMYVKIPSLTNLSNVVLRIYADSTSNFQKFTTSTDYTGASLATGWNLLLFDVSTGGTAGGTGWDYSKLARYVEVGVTASSGAQTYTGIIFDSLYFSTTSPQNLGVNGMELTLFDNSHKDDIIVDHANTSHDGHLTLAASVSNTYVGGLSGSSRGRVARSTILAAGDNSILFNNDATFSGAVTTAQELRIAAMLRASLTSSYKGLIDFIPIQIYKVTTVGGSTLVVNDPTDQSANLKNGDTVDIFHPYYVAGKTTYVLVSSVALTADATATGGATTLTVSPAGVTVGDYVAKRPLTQLAASAVSATSNENFAALTLATLPDGAELLDKGINYPSRDTVWGHWKLGGFSATDATANLQGAGPALTYTGALSQSQAFLFGQYSATGFTDSNYYSMTGALTAPINGNVANVTTVALSIWINYTGTVAHDRYIYTCLSTGATLGYALRILNGTATIRFNSNDGSDFNTDGTLSTGWNNVVVQFKGNSVASGQKIWVNGALAATTTGSTDSNDSSHTFYVGHGYTTGNPADSGLSLADLTIWRNPPDVTQSFVDQIYAKGAGVALGFGPLLRYKYAASSLTGQKLSLRARVARTTTGVQPIISKMAII